MKLLKVAAALLCAVSGTAFCQVVNPGGGGSTTASSIIAALGNPSGLTIAGDSLGAATGATNLSLGYASLLRPQIGGYWYNYSTPGDLCLDSNKVIYSNVNPSPGSPATVNECGTNDTTVYNSDANKQLSFRRIVMGNYLQAAIPLANKKFAQSCTKTTGFITNDNTFIFGMAASTVLSGDVLTCSVTTGPNGNIALSYLITTAGVGTFTVTVNGVTQTDPIGGTTTFSAFGDGSASISTTNGVTKGFAGVVLTGFPANTAATVVITTTAASTTAAPVEVAWVAGMPALSTSNPNLIVVSPNHQNNANDALSGTYAGYEQAIASSLVGYGLNVMYADTRSALGTNYATFYADTLHPNNAGHALMASTIVAAVPSLITNAPPSLQAGPSSIFQPNAAPPVNPSQFWTTNPYFLGDGVNTWSPGILLGKQGGNAQFLASDSTHGAYIAGPNAGAVSLFSICAYLPGSIYPSAPSAMTCPFKYLGNGVLDMSAVTQILVGSIAATHGNANASASTTNGQRVVFHVTGTAAIDTLTTPSGWGATYGGCINIIPDGAFTTTTAGNIAVASTAVVGKVLTECWDGTKWYPSY